MDHLTTPYQRIAWAAAREAVLNSADAAAIAITCERNPEAARVLNAHPKKLRLRLEHICFEEIRRATEEAHVGAVIEDIECIEDALGYRLDAAKAEGYERIQELFFGEDVEDEPNATEYFETLKQSLDEFRLHDAQEMAYVDELFEGFAADRL